MDLWRDLQQGARLLRKQTGFAAAALLTLALGIGASTAIFSVVDGVLLRPLPYAAPERLVLLRETNPPRFPELVVRPPRYREWREQITSLRGLAAVRTRSYNLTGAGDPIRIAAARVTGNTLATLGVQPALGRDFAAGEDLPGKQNVVLLSHGFWRRQLGARGDVLGHSLQLDGQPFTVVGVLPAGFQFHRPVDLLIPADYPTDGQVRRSLGVESIVVFGRLAPEATIDRAREELAVISGRLAQQSSANRGWGAKVESMAGARVAAIRPVVLALAAAAGFLLLVASANVAGLLLGRGTARARELAVRAALGASRGRLVRQLLAEGVVLGAASVILGLAIARAGVSALLVLAPDDLPRAQEIAVDVRALVFSCALALVVGLASALAPALRATRVELARALGASGQGVAVAPQRHRLHGALVVTEVAIALVLLAGAGLLGRSLSRMYEVDRGFRPEQASTFDVSLPGGRYDSPARLAAFAGDLAARLAAVPGVAAAGAVQALPFSVQLNLVYFEVAGRPPLADPPITHVFMATPGYFEAMGIRLLRGRLFDARDRAGAPGVAIINESLARRHFPGQDPIGQRVGRAGAASDPERSGEIVGVVGDVRGDDLAGAVAMQTYVPLAQQPYDTLTFVVRAAAGAPAPAPAAIRAAVQTVDLEQPLDRLRPLSELVAVSMARQRFAASIFVAFSLAALALAGIGVYGVIAQSVLQRRGELGIRRALGAQTADVVRLVAAEGGRLIAFGLALGLAGAVLLARSLRALLFGVTGHDPLVLGLMAMVVSLVGVVACLVPVRRALAVDPMTALRSG